MAESDALVDDLDAEAVVLVDLLRRARRFDQAAERARESLAAGLEDAFLTRLLEYELALIERLDDAAHTTDGAGHGSARKEDADSR